MTDKKDVRHAFAEYVAVLREQEGSLTDNQYRDLVKHIDRALNDAEEWAKCDHENIESHINPGDSGLHLEYLITQAEEMDEQTDTLTVFHAKCDDCGASGSTVVELKYEFSAEEEDDD